MRNFNETEVCVDCKVTRVLVGLVTVEHDAFEQPLRLRDDGKQLLTAVA